MDTFMTKFWNLCESGHLEGILSLYSRSKITLDDIRSENNWALVLACGRGYLDVAKWLYSQGLTLFDIEESHAIWWACRYGQLHVAEWLISLGIKLGKNDLINILESACEYRYVDVVRWILPYLKSEDIKPNFTKLALRKACECGSIEICKLLIANGAMRGIDAASVFKDN